MNILLSIQDTQGLIDGAIIGVCIIAILAIGTWMDRREQAQWNRPLLVPDDHPVLDHWRCVHVDQDGRRCTTVLCFCNTLHPATGQPVTCAGADRPACDHSLVSRATPGGHCSTHQRSCPDCQLEDSAMFGTLS